jgi:hypothetical protein
VPDDLFGKSVHVANDLTEPVGAGGNFLQLIGLTGETSEPDDVAVGISQRNFGRDHQTRRSFGLRRTFHSINDGFAAVHYGFVVAAIFIGTATRKEIVIRLAPRIPFRIDAAVFTASTIQRHEPTFAVLQKEGHIRQQIKQSQQLSPRDTANERLLFSCIHGAGILQARATIIQDTSRELHYTSRQHAFAVYDARVFCVVRRSNDAALSLRPIL